METLKTIMQTKLRNSSYFHRGNMSCFSRKDAFECPTEEDKDRLFCEDHVLGSNGSVVQKGSPNVPQSVRPGPKKMLSHLIKKQAIATSGRLYDVCDLKSNKQPMAISPKILNYDIKDLERLFTTESWKIIQDSVKVLEDEWRCTVCFKAKHINMIECEACDAWVGWDCAKISEEPDNWTCQRCQAYKMSKMND